MGFGAMSPLMDGLDAPVSPGVAPFIGSWAYAIEVARAKLTVAASMLIFIIVPFVAPRQHASLGYGRLKPRLSTIPCPRWRFRPRRCIEAQWPSWIKRDERVLVRWLHRLFRPDALPICKKPQRHGQKQNNQSEVFKEPEHRRLRTRTLHEQEKPEDLTIDLVSRQEATCWSRSRAKSKLPLPQTSRRREKPDHPGAQRSRRVFPASPS